MPIIENTYRNNQLPAHEEVEARRANKLTNTAWPVSGDQTRLAHGYIGMRRASQRVNIWSGSNVNLRGRKEHE